MIERGAWEKLTGVLEAGRRGNCLIEAAALSTNVELFFVSCGAGRVTSHE